MRYFKKLFVWLNLIIAITLLACSDNGADDRYSSSNKSSKVDRVITVGVTTTIEDAGLLNPLIKAFQEQYTLNVKPIVAGSGQIHKLLELGDLDVAMTHDPVGEKALLLEGSIKYRIPLMQNDFLIVGPKTDPADIKLSLTPSEALEKIVDLSALFVSRADNSGTHQMEQYWWGEANRLPTDQNYLKTGTGMGATLNIAAERNAYTLVDRATWTKFANKQQLAVLFENPDLMPNVYSLLIKNEAPVPEKVVLWQNWITKGEGLQIILNYRINGQPLFLEVH